MGFEGAVDVMTMVIGVDPGETTGVCSIHLEDGHIVLWSGKPMDAVQWVEDILSYTKDVHVVCERFMVTPQTHRHTRQLAALEVIGALRYICLKPEGVTFELQSRADRTRVRGLVKTLGQPRNDHEVDALEHAILGAVRHGSDRFRKFLLRSTED